LSFPRIISWSAQAAATTRHLARHPARRINLLGQTKLLDGNAQLARIVRVVRDGIGQ
jgi:hypothetical protein